MCETMASLICRASNLKSDNIECKGSNLSVRVCDQCDMFQEENVEHVIMHCPFNEYLREHMLLDIHNLECMYDVSIMGSGNPLLTLLGSARAEIDPCIMNKFWVIAGSAIHKMYMRIETAKKGIG